MNILRWWRNEWERTLAVFLVVLGLLAFLNGWLGLSDKGLVTQQVPYLVSGPLLGLFLLGVGATLWLSADMHDEWVKLDRLQEVVERAVPADTVTSRPATFLHDGTSDAEGWPDEHTGRTAARASRGRG
jgi:hypothetical protein